ncbi:putative bacteriophage protein [Pantoea stewartii subsp. stewartii DC283]|uniref:Putative bacteriophage protein n=1 Tax=Pantoea stewartii subsp. stewartii DC283 TaxID=660596 RepID=H3RG50_PANSE|nr:putative bacteriophage protein [Pantoea stewartii subsp. stewartii DC283]
MKSGVTMRVDKAQSVLDALKTIGNRDVLVGIPAEDSARDDAPFGNAGIGYINENGSPAQNIPAK